MTPTAIALVLASTITHAYWNFLIKRSGGGSAFVGMSKVMEALIFAPVFLIWFLPDFEYTRDALVFIAGGAFLSLANYLALARAYETGDLSVVYPVARGGTLLFLPILGYLVFGERLSPLGWLALACIVAGILVIRLAAFSTEALSRLGHLLWTPAIAFALLASLTTAGYTVWDKRAVNALPAFPYFYSYTVVSAVLYAALLLKSHSRGALRSELRLHAWPIAQVGFFNTTSYLLVLVALRTGTSSYVLALRQLSIALGVLLGWKILGETMHVPKRVGVALLVLGCVLVAFAR